MIMIMILILIFLIILYYSYNNKDNFTNITKNNKWNNNLYQELIVNNKHCGNTNNLSEINNNNILMAYNYNNINPDNTNDVAEIYNIINQKYDKDSKEIIDNVSSSKPLHYSLNITHEDIKYNLLGYAVNKYYKQHYLIYESYIIQDNDYYLKDNLDYLNQQLYKYVLVKTENNQLKIIHVFGPRSKINIGDIVNLSYGVYQLGPLEILQNI